MMRSSGKAGDAARLTLRRRAEARSGAKVGGRFILECRGADGRLKWRDVARNLVVNVGLQHMLDTEFLAGSQVSAWYVGLTTGSPSPAAGDTMASHAGWAEYQNYSEAGRQVWNKARTGQTVSNSANKAQFSISGAGGTVGGAFLATDSTKGGSTGTLMCCCANSGGNRTVAAGDTVTAQYDFSAADDGV